MVLCGKPWKYINEGNVHIVLQILGTDLVVRLIKENVKTVDRKTVHDSVDFVNIIMNPLLYQGYNNLQEVLQLSSSELTDLRTNLTMFRPEVRKFKSHLSPYAIKAPNLTVLSLKCTSNFCIEIKPKEGFMASSFNKYMKCYYCLKQYLKLQQQKIDTKSEYCPLDLFSGNKERMKYALENLVNNPQNNFKLFKESKLIYNEKSCRTDFDHAVDEMIVFGSNTSLFLDFIIEILLSNNCDKQNIVLKEMTTVSKPLKTEHCVNTNMLDNSAFLYNVYYLQKLLEDLRFNSTDMGDCRRDTDFDYVSSIINQLKARNLNLNNENSRKEFIEMTNPKHLALISAVARDCSIMISFSPIFEAGFSTVQIGEHLVPYKIAVTDLEPKSMKTLTKRLKSEKKLIDVYETYCESSKIIN